MAKKETTQTDGSFGASYRATLDAAAARASVARAAAVPARARAASDLLASYISKIVTAISSQQVEISKGNGRPEAINFYTGPLLLTEAEATDLSGMRRLTTFCENSDINLSLRFNTISGNANNIAVSVIIDPSKPFEKKAQGELKF